MDLKDNKGRWIKVTSPEIKKGRSACNGCGKDMPRYWDVICKKCNRTLCYDCAKIYGDFWYCDECLKEVQIMKDAD